MTVEYLMAILGGISDKSQTVFISSKSDLSDNTADVEVVEIGISSLSGVHKGVYIINGEE